ncbi:hypothetical protein, partial [Croceitalea vernalis]
EEVTICEGSNYEWDLNGETYSVSDSPVMINLEDSNGCEYKATLIINEEVCGGGSCETAFARYENDNTCFIDDGFQRWGWTNLFSTNNGSYTLDFYAGAGQCVINADRKWGEVQVEFNNGMAKVTVNMDNGYVLNVAQMYIGGEKYPTKGNGMPTVAPGQYPYNSGELNEVSSYEFEEVDVSTLDNVYIIVHGDVCEGQSQTNSIQNTKLNGLASFKTFQKPFTKTITMELNMPYSSHIDVDFMDLSGRVINSSMTRNLTKGKHMMHFETNNLASEVHILKVRTDREVIIKKVIIFK